MRLSPTWIRSNRPKAALKRPSPAAISSSVEPSAAGERGGGERVVDVVEAGKRELDPPRALGGDEVEGGPLEPGELDRPSRHLERRPGVAAGGAAVVAEVPDVGGRVLVRRAAPDAVLRVGGVLERRSRDPGVVEAVHGGQAVLRRERSELRVVAVDDERGGRRRARRPPRASAARRARARRSGRAGRERDCRGRRCGARTRRITSGRAASSTSSSASSASAEASRVEATPETRLAPERLWARRKRGSRISAAIAAVVVLPFVAEMTAAPAGSLAASRSIAPGSSFERSLPGHRRAAARAGEARQRSDAARRGDLSGQRDAKLHGRSVFDRGRPSIEGTCPSGGRDLTLPGEGALPPLRLRFSELHVFCGPCACLRADMKREKEGTCGLIERVVAVIAQTHFGDVARVASRVRMLSGVVAAVVPARSLRRSLSSAPLRRRQLRQASGAARERVRQGLRESEVLRRARAAERDPAEPQAVV